MRLNPFLKAAQDPETGDVLITFTKFYWVHPSFWRVVLRARKEAE